MRGIGRAPASPTPAATRLPPTAAPLLDFASLLRRFGFAVAPEQSVTFMRAVTLLGPRSMSDIYEAALASLAPPPERRAEFEALFRDFFFGEATITGDTSGDDEETAVRDDAGARWRENVDVRDMEGGALASAAEQLGVRGFAGAADPLAPFRRDFATSLPMRRSFRHFTVRTRGRLDLRRSLRDIVRADGDVPAPRLRRRAEVARRVILLIDISGSMKRHTADHLRLAHCVVQAAAAAEVFTLGTRLTRITPALRTRAPELALRRAAALVEDWDGGTRIGPTLLAFLSVPRYAAMARGAAIIIVSDALERGDPSQMVTAMTRLAGRAHRLSLATPLAGDPRFRPATAALRAILPLLDDLVDGSSLPALTSFLLTLARPASSAATVWRHR
ncbi:MAG: VWA domain-containing protein [Rhizobiaceae bacterium]|nr:VWA domain-containing protein [Rhizobiaceae bacterium]